jgi:hypothetical protein
VDVYEQETREIMRRFLAGDLSFPDCIAALDAALAGLIPELKPAELHELRALMLANKEQVPGPIWLRAHPCVRVADYAPGAATVRSDDLAFSIKLAWHENLLNLSRPY